MSKFDELSAAFQSDKHLSGYGPHYERHVLGAMDRDWPVSLLEIGVNRGGSLRMWEGLWPNIRIYGIDNNPEAKAAESEKAKVFIGDQADPEFLRSVLLEAKHLDFVVDDGSHHLPDMLVSFNTLWPATGKVYVIEDIWYEFLPALENEVHVKCPHAVVYPSRFENRHIMFAVKP